MNDPRWDIVVVGGGPAGSTAALFLLKAGFRTCLVEKKAFPRETVCGEFLSREVVRTLEDLGLAGSFAAMGPNPLRSFRFCPRHVGSATSRFSFLAYAMKRGLFDSFLLDEVRRAGGEVYQPATVQCIEGKSNLFSITVKGAGGALELSARQIVGAYGKSGGPESPMRRNAGMRRSRLNGVKFHVPRYFFRNLPSDEIQIYAGKEMYCGLNVVDGGTATMSFLERRSSDDMSPRDRIRDLLETNEHFARAAIPELTDVIDSMPVYGAGSIDFGKHRLFSGGIFLTGDAARVIAPLAGDGMGMAMQSGKVLAATLAEGRSLKWDDERIGALYEERWNKLFWRRLSAAMALQRLLLSRFGSEWGGWVVSRMPSVLFRLVESTRG